MKGRLEQQLPTLVRPLLARARPRHTAKASPRVDGSGQRGRAWWLLFSALICSLVPAAATLAQSLPLDPYFDERQSMVDKQIRDRGIDEPQLLRAMREVPRHRFLPERHQRQAYRDEPLPIDSGQTFHQAYLSARMIALLGLESTDRVLEIGTGTGYDAALLSRLAGTVYTIEIDPALGKAAEKTLRSLGFDNVEVKIGDGYLGWPEKAPFDGILLTVASEAIPEPLLEQLAVGGKLVAAVGTSFFQELRVITRSDEKTFDSQAVPSPVRVGTMEGEARKQR